MKQIYLSQLMILGWRWSARQSPDQLYLVRATTTLKTGAAPSVALEPQ